MAGRLLRVGLGLALGLGLVGMSRAGADEKKADAGTSPSKAPDWSGYAKVTEFTAEVVKADDDGVTVRVYYLAPNKGGNKNRRPPLHNHGLNLQNPLARRGGSGQRPQVHWDHHDYTIPYAPEGMARTKKLPPKTDADGKKVDYTQKEMDALKEPSGAPGYTAAKSDLAAGSVVDLILVRDKSIAADKVTEADLKIKYATILAGPSNPYQSSPAAKEPPKKKN